MPIIIVIGGIVVVSLPISNGLTCSGMGLINKVDMVCLSPVGYGV